jgi:hypothetical protein
MIILIVTIAIVQDSPGPFFIREHQSGIAIERFKSSNFDRQATAAWAVLVCVSRGSVEFYLAPALVISRSSTKRRGAKHP